MKAVNSKYCQCIYFSSNALARKMERLAQESWKPTGLSPSHAYLLMLVLENPGIQPGALTTQLLLSPSTITRLIEKLEEKKLLVRHYEGKSTFVHPTRKATELEPLMRQCVAHFYNASAALLAKDKHNTLVSRMNEVSDMLPG